jgi:hypothetical protein
MVGVTSLTDGGTEGSDPESDSIATGNRVCCIEAVEFVEVDEANRETDLLPSFFLSVRSGVFSSDSAGPRAFPCLCAVLDPPSPRLKVAIATPKRVSR